MIGIWEEIEPIGKHIVAESQSLARQFEKNRQQPLRRLNGL